MFSRFAAGQRSEDVVLDEGLFTADEAERIRALRHQNVIYPDSFRLDVNYRHLQFVRWLVQHGHLGEGIKTFEDVEAGGYESLKWADPTWI